MKEILSNLVKANAGPLIFILVAIGACMILPPDIRKDPLLLVVGAALTRVKRTDAK